MKIDVEINIAFKFHTRPKKLGAPGWGVMHITHVKHVNSDLHSVYRREKRFCNTGGYIRNRPTAVSHTSQTECKVHVSDPWFSPRAGRECLTEILTANRRLGNEDSSPVLPFNRHIYLITVIITNSWLVLLSPFCCLFEPLSKMI